MHKIRVWNRLSSDQFGEQAYIRYCKVKGGLKGMTLSEDQSAGWVVSYHLCNIMNYLMDIMFNDKCGGTNDVHTEGLSRRKQDDADRLYEQSSTNIHIFLKQQQCPLS